MGKGKSAGLREIYSNMFAQKGKNAALSDSFQCWFGHEPQTRFVYVYVCYYCGEEFTLRESLQNHLSCCNMIPPNGPSQQALTKENPPETAQYQDETTDQSLSRSVQGDSDKIVSGQTHLKSKVTTCVSPVKDSFKKSLTPLKTLGRPSSPYAFNKVSKTRYLTGLGLMPIQKARRVSERRRSTQCENIDLAEDALPSPSKPRTPKLLISHLSRDDSNGSGAESSKSCVRSLFTTLNSRIDEHVEDFNMMEGLDDEKGNQMDAAGKPQEKLKLVKSLFNIAISSPLGQFVMKHYKGDPSLHVTSDIESHCVTEVTENQEGLRLRERHPVYPVTFRGYLRVKDLYSCHKYNFNKDHKKEFLRRVRTGLDRKSRALSRKMKKCTVDLTRLTETELKLWLPSQNQLTVDLRHLTPQEIMYWMSPKPNSGTNQPAVFPSGLSLASPNLNKVLGLRTRVDKDNNSSPLYRQLSMTNFVSEQVAAEVTENRRTVLNSILFDLIGKGEVSKDQPAVIDKKLPQQHVMGNYSTLRRLLLGSNNSALSKVCTLPDITNLASADRCKTPRPDLYLQQLENKPSDKKLDLKPSLKVFQGGQTSSKSKKSGDALQPSSSSAQSSVVKSTVVRLAQEGDTIAVLESCQSYTNPSTVSPTEKVFPDNPLSKNTPVATPSTLPACSETSRILRKRPSKICILDQQQEQTPLRVAPVFLVEGEERSTGIWEEQTDAHCPDSAPVQSLPGPVKLVTRCMSDVEYEQDNCSVTLPKQSHALHDVQFKKKLLSAGLIWRAAPQLGQENRSTNQIKTVIKPEICEPKQTFGQPPSVRRKRGRPPKNKSQTGSKTSCPPLRGHVLRPKTKPLERKGNPLRNLVRCEWGKEVTGQARTKQGLGSHSRSLYKNVRTRNKPGRYVNGSAKKTDSVVCNDVFTTLKATQGTGQ